MERKEFIQSKKYYLKGLAQHIRELKNELRQYYKDRNTLSYEDHKKKINGRWDYVIKNDIEKAKYEFRHEHIVYCLARKVKKVFNGTLTTEEANERYYAIERTCHDGNYPDWSYIREIYDTYPVIPQVDNEAVVCSDTE